ncbi:MAG: sigma-70 family RNA polymerase sigma factor [Anaerolineales bacterium]|jgi:RNA polymerase sigma-70 factor (ECF subfamily)
MSSVGVCTNQISTSGILHLLLEIYQVKDRINFMEAEKALLTGLRGLDPQAITEIHNKYFPLVYRYAYYRIGDETVCEDLSSETFIRLLEAVHAGRSPKSSLRGWLMGTISNLVNDYYRKIYNKPNQPLHDDLVSHNSDPVSLSEEHTRQEILRLGLKELTSEQQHVLALRFGSGCSLAETADVMKKKPNAIKQLQFRAIAALRKYIEGEI